MFPISKKRLNICTQARAPSKTNIPLKTKMHLASRCIRIFSRGRVRRYAED